MNVKRPALATLLLALLWTSPAQAQGNQCRTSPVGANTAYCSSEAFVTQHFPGSSTAGHAATFADGSGQVLADGGAPPASLTEPQGRLTLQANTPVMTVSQLAQSTLRYDCMFGNQVPYFNGAADAVDTIAACEVTDAMVSAASAGQVVSGQVYDAWWVHSGANRICLAMSVSSGGGGGWASDTGGSITARGTGYSQLDKITRPYITNKNAIANCFNAAVNYGPVSANQATYLGTIYATANGQSAFQFGSGNTSGQNGLFGIFNAYNQKAVTTAVSDTTASWVYSTATFRQARASASNQVQYVDGLGTASVQAHYDDDIVTVTASGATAIGIDSTSALSGRQGFVAAGATADSFSTYYGVPGSGLHTVAALEKGGGSGTQTFFGGAFMQLSVQINGM